MARRRHSPFLFTDEAAAWLRVRARTLINMRHRKEGPECSKHGGRVVYTLEDLKAWSKGRRRKR